MLSSKLQEICLNSIPAFFSKFALVGELEASVIIKIPYSLCQDK